MTKFNCRCGNGHVPGRACTPTAKRAFLEKMYRAWNERPTERFGQFLVNMGARECGSCHPGDLFGQEDDALANDALKRVGLVSPTTDDARVARVMAVMLEATVIADAQLYISLDEHGSDADMRPVRWWYPGLVEHSLWSALCASEAKLGYDGYAPRDRSFPGGKDFASQTRQSGPAYDANRLLMKKVFRHEGQWYRLSGRQMARRILAFLEHAPIAALLRDG